VKEEEGLRKKIPDKIAGLFNDYIRAVDWVRKNKTASREEKLKRLIPHLVELLPGA